MPNITVQWYAGRTDQQRREIVKAITDAMVKIGKTTPDQVHIVFQDVERSHWGVNGGLEPEITGYSVKQAYESGSITRALRADEVIDRTIVEKLLRELGTM